MATKHTLSAEKRTITGRKVKKVRQTGLLPASLYGKDTDSQSLQVNLKEFQKLEKQVGETGLIYLQVEKLEHPVLIKNLQFHPITGIPLHADFHKVNLKEEIKANVPIEIKGEPQAVAESKGILIQPLSELEVQALPTDLPEDFTLDVSHLAEVDDAIYVKDIKVPAGVKVISDPEEIVAKISPLAKEEVVEAPPAEAEEAQAEELETAQTEPAETSAEEPAPEKAE